MRTRHLAVVIAILALAACSRPAPPPSPTPPSAIAPSPSRSAVALAAPTVDLPSFPLVPGWEPRSLGDRVAGRVGPDFRLIYGDGSRMFVLAETGPTQWDWEAARTVPTRVGAAKATLRTGTDADGRLMQGLTWHATPWWVTVESFGALTPQDLIRYAESLRPGTIPAVRPPMTVGLAPPGMVLQSLDVNGLCLSFPPKVAIRYTAGDVCVHLGAGTANDPAGAVTLTNGRRANIANPAQIEVILDGSHTYWVTVDEGLKLDQETLLRIAGSVTVR